MKYRKKPVVIEAVQWLGGDESWEEILKFSENPHYRRMDLLAGNGKITIKTLEGEMTADKGDWIIKGIKGEFYPCKPDIFEQTYEKVEERTKKGER